MGDGVDAIQKKQADAAIQLLAREGMAMKESRVFITVKPTDVTDEGEGSTERNCGTPLTFSWKL